MHHQQHQQPPKNRQQHQTNSADNDISPWDGRTGGGGDVAHKQLVTNLQSNRTHYIEHIKAIGERTTWRLDPSVDPKK